jgi:hypothetical protein
VSYKEMCERIAEWRALANDFSVTRGDSEIEEAYYRCAREAEAALAGIWWCAHCDKDLVICTCPDNGTRNPCLRAI